MGCDIHAFLEIKIFDDWHFYSKVPLERDYQIFARLAGVRARKEMDIHPIAPPRGLPSNVSLLVNIHSEHYGIDGHSHSWISSQEVLDLYKWIRERFLKSPDGAVLSGRYPPPWEGRCWTKSFGVWLFGNSVHDFFKYPEQHPEIVQDFRMVFFFDN